MTYYDAVCSNIELLRVIGLLHPRLALLGIDSEIEVVIREILPRCNDDVIRVDDTLERRTALDLERMAMRHQIGDIFNTLPPELRHVISRLRDKANCCRHSRFFDVDSSTVSHFADKALTFIQVLAQEKYFLPIRGFSADCKRCAPSRTVRHWYSTGTQLCYSLTDVFQAVLGSTMSLHCCICDDALLVLEIPRADEVTRCTPETENLITQLRQLMKDPEKK